MCISISSECWTKYRFSTLCILWHCICNVKIVCAANSCSILQQIESKCLVWKTWIWSPSTVSCCWTLRLTSGAEAVAAVVLTCSCTTKIPANQIARRIIRTEVIRKVLQVPHNVYLRMYFKLLLVYGFLSINELK